MTLDRLRQTTMRHPAHSPLPRRATAGFAAVTAAAVAAPSVYLLGDQRRGAAPEPAPSRACSAGDQVRDPRARARRGRRHRADARRRSIRSTTRPSSSRLTSSPTTAPTTPPRSCAGAAGASTNGRHRTIRARVRRSTGCSIGSIADGEPFDAIVIVDADTTVDPGFLRAMDRQVRAGRRARRRATTRFETPMSRPPRASASPRWPAATTSGRSVGAASAGHPVCTATA